MVTQVIGEILMNEINLESRGGTRELKLQFNNLIEKNKIHLNLNSMI